MLIYLAYIFLQNYFAGIEASGRIMITPELDKNLPRNKIYWERFIDIQAKYIHRSMVTVTWWEKL